MADEKMQKLYDEIVVRRDDYLKIVHDLRYQLERAYDEDKRKTLNEEISIIESKFYEAERIAHIIAMRYL